MFNQFLFEKITKKEGRLRQVFWLVLYDNLAILVRVAWARTVRNIFLGHPDLDSCIVNISDYLMVTNSMNKLLIRSKFC